MKLEKLQKKINKISKIDHTLKIWMSKNMSVLNASQMAQTIIDTANDVFNKESIGPDKVNYTGAYYNGFESSLKKLI